MYIARIREFGNSIGDAFSQIGKSMKRPFERFSMNRPYERFQPNNLDQIELNEIQYFSLAFETKIVPF